MNIEVYNLIQRIIVEGQWSIHGISYSQRNLSLKNAIYVKENDLIILCLFTCYKEDDDDESLSPFSS